MDGSIRPSSWTLRLQFNMIFTCRELLFFNHLIHKVNGPTKVCLVKAMVFPVVTSGRETSGRETSGRETSGCESWTIKKAEH